MSRLIVPWPSIAVDTFLANEVKKKEKKPGAKKCRADLCFMNRSNHLFVKI